ncbi:mucin-4-like isoform X2 [Pleurodeles waltl]|uniref:mucin-4-like isoform X2 n=1 Tax=Pleurodeles waltl TaxID=8319 RepID=UPI0037094843
MEPDSTSKAISSIETTTESPTTSPIIETSESTSLPSSTIVETATKTISISTVTPEETTQLPSTSTIIVISESKSFPNSTTETFREPTYTSSTSMESDSISKAISATDTTDPPISTIIVISGSTSLPSLTTESKLPSTSTITGKSESTHMQSSTTGETATERISLSSSTKAPEASTRIKSEHTSIAVTTAPEPSKAKPTALTSGSTSLSTTTTETRRESTSTATSSIAPERTSIAILTAAAEPSTATPTALTSGSTRLSDTTMETRTESTSTATSSIAPERTSIAILTAAAEPSTATPTALTSGSTRLSNTTMETRTESTSTATSSIAPERTSIAILTAAAEPSTATPTALTSGSTRLSNTTMEIRTESTSTATSSFASESTRIANSTAAETTTEPTTRSTSIVTSKSTTKPTSPAVPMVHCTLPCLNGMCVMSTTSRLPRCDCKTGFVADASGGTCIDKNECQLDSQLCDQACRNTIGAFQCGCTDGYQLDAVNNRTCLRIDFCSGSPCGNGRCTSTLHEFVCTCSPGWKGKTCGQDVDECESDNRCSRRSTCKNTPGSYTCNCNAGWTGPTCSEDIDECLSSPCVNGKCKNIPGSYSCRCSAGWTGLNCDSDINECLSQPCRNDGTCNDLINDFSCSCKPGYSGRFCEIDIDDCKGVLCANRGICIDGINNYTCRCTPNWQGLLCDIDVNECSMGLSRCHSNAVCANTVGSYICTCNAGYKGDGFSCREIRLFDYSGDWRATQLRQDFTSQFISIPIGFPFDKDFYNSLYFTDNGVIVFQRNRYEPSYTFRNPYVFFKTDFSTPPMIAAFWADADFSAGGGQLYYRVFDFQRNPSTTDFKSSLEASISTYFKTLDTPFSALWAIRITWEQVLPFPARDFSREQGPNTNTYQAVLVTDGIYSFCLILFEDGGMNWRHEALPTFYTPKMGYFSGQPRTSSSSTFPAYNDPQTYGSIEQVYRPDKYPGAMTGKNGIFAYRLENNKNSTQNPRKNCLNWYFSEPPPYWSFSTAPCPCTLIQALADPNFASEELLTYYGFQINNPGYYYAVQSISPGWTGAGSRCYYNSFNGPILFGTKERYLPAPWVYGHWAWASYSGWYAAIFKQIRTQYQVSEINPYNACCGDFRSFDLCPLYYEKRPSDACYGYIPPRRGFFFGDPHIYTLDGLTYTFNGLGEFILANARNENDTVVFRLQGRTARAGNGTSPATNFVGLAAEVINGTKVQWGILDENTTTVMVNGSFLSVRNATYFDKVLLAVTEQNESRASFEGGISVTVSARLGALTFVTSFDNSYQNRTEGLLGVFNGDRTDDLTAANGTRLQFDGTKLPNESLIFEMGMTWKTTPANSLFDYNEAEGESWSTYNNNSFVPAFYDDLLLSTNSSLIQKANETCKGNDECIFDVLSTGNFAFGETTLQGSKMFTQQQKAIGNFPPNITGPSELHAALNEAAVAYYVATDQDNDPVTFTVVTNSTDVTITENGTLIWKPTSSDPVYVTVRANDSKITQDKALTLILCNCTNNATCNYNATTVSDERTAQFQTAECGCTEAYAGRYCTDDYDACQIESCYVKTSCNDTRAPGAGHTCDPCPVGLTGDGIKCADYDECTQNKSNCQQNCINIFGGFNCSCWEGYRVSSVNSSECDDIDECAETSPCAAAAICTNSPGGYSCDCPAGFRGNATFVCTDIDECADTNSTICPKNSVCNNSIGSYKCDCFVGYNGTNCTDIDECASSSTTCPITSECINNMGSFTCQCKEGYDGEKCTDIDECATNQDNCHNDAFCNNTDGSFTCTCRPGFTGNGTDCQDVNECELSPSSCQVNEDCQNIRGGFQCPCTAGYSLVNGTCQDDDECTLGRYCTGMAEECQNTPGTYSCRCTAGYLKVNSTCQDIDECLNDTLNTCSKSNGICSNIGGSYHCSCKPGFQGDGVDCTALITTTQVFTDEATHSGTVSTPLAARTENATQGITTLTTSDTSALSKGSDSSTTVTSAASTSSTQVTKAISTEMSNQSTGAVSTATSSILHPTTTSLSTPTNQTFVASSSSTSTAPSTVVLVTSTKSTEQTDATSEAIVTSAVSRTAAAAITESPRATHTATSAMMMTTQVITDETTHSGTVSTPLAARTENATQGITTITTSDTSALSKGSDSSTTVTSAASTSSTQVTKAISTEMSNQSTGAVSTATSSTLHPTTSSLSTTTNQTFVATSSSTSAAPSTVVLVTSTKSTEQTNATSEAIVTSTVSRTAAAAITESSRGTHDATRALMITTQVITDETTHSGTVSTPLAARTENATQGITTITTSDTSALSKGSDSSTTVTSAASTSSTQVTKAISTEMSNQSTEAVSTATSSTLHPTTTSLSTPTNQTFVASSSSTSAAPSTVVLMTSTKSSEQTDATSEAIVTSTVSRTAAAAITESPRATHTATSALMATTQVITDETTHSGTVSTPLAARTENATQGSTTLTTSNTSALFKGSESSTAVTSAASTSSTLVTKAISTEMSNQSTGAVSTATSSTLHPTTSSLFTPTYQSIVPSSTSTSAAPSTVVQVTTAKSTEQTNATSEAIVTSTVPRTSTVSITESSRATHDATRALITTKPVITDETTHSRAVSTHLAAVTENATQATSTIKTTDTSALFKGSVGSTIVTSAASISSAQVTKAISTEMSNQSTDSVSTATNSTLHPTTSSLYTPTYQTIVPSSSSTSAAPSTVVQVTTAKSTEQTNATSEAIVTSTVSRTSTAIITESSRATHTATSALMATTQVITDETTHSGTVSTSLAARTENATQGITTLTTSNTSALFKGSESSTAVTSAASTSSTLVTKAISTEMSNQSTEAESKATSSTLHPTTSPLFTPTYQTIAPSSSSTSAAPSTVRVTSSKSTEQTNATSEAIATSTVSRPAASTITESSRTTHTATSGLITTAQVMMNITTEFKTGSPDQAPGTANATKGITTITRDTSPLFNGTRASTTATRATSTSSAQVTSVKATNPTTGLDIITEAVLTPLTIATSTKNNETTGALTVVTPTTPDSVIGTSGTQATNESKNTTNTTLSQLIKSTSTSPFSEFPTVGTEATSRSPSSVNITKMATNTLKTGATASTFTSAAQTVTKPVSVFNITQLSATPTTFVSTGVNILPPPTTEATTTYQKPITNAIAGTSQYKTSMATPNTVSTNSTTNNVTSEMAVSKAMQTAANVTLTTMTNLSSGTSVNRISSTTKKMASTTTISSTSNNVNFQTEGVNGTTTTTAKFSIATPTILTINPPVNTTSITVSNAFTVKTTEQTVSSSAVVAKSTVSATTTTKATTTSRTTQNGTGAVQLYTYGLIASDTEFVQRTTNFNSRLFKPDIGFPFGKQLYTSLYFTDNGQIIFPRSDNDVFSYVNPPPDGFTESNRVPMVAVFWDNADFSNNVGSTFYQEYVTLNSATNTLVQDVEAKIQKYMKTSYTAKWTLKVTWDNAPALPAKDKDAKTNTYQAVLTTDGTTSYILMLFKDGGMNWDVASLSKTNVLVGYSSGQGDRFFKNDDLTKLSPAEKYRPSNIVGHNTDLRGLWIYKLDSNSASVNYRLKCLEWYNTQKAPTSWNSNLLACPCSLQQGRLDLRFRRTRAGLSTTVEMLRSTLPNHYGSGVRCSYTQRGLLTAGYQEQVWMFSRYSSADDAELQPFDWCCNKLGNPSFCNRYMEKRPRIGCTGYVPLFPAWMFGDPHITTLDAHGYTFNGLGDFTLLNATDTDSSFMLQGRTTQTGTALATNFNAFASQYSSGSKKIQVEWFLQNDTLQVALNKKIVNFLYSEDMEANIYNDTGIFLVKGSNSITATFDGLLVVSVSQSLGILSAVSSLPTQYINRTSGLLGVWNSNTADDFLMPNGTTIAINSSDLDIYNYGMTWQVSGTSLFSFAVPTTVQSKSTFTPLFLGDLKKANASGYGAASSVCGGNIECIYDTLSTGNSAIGAETQRLATTFGEANSTLNTYPPVITGTASVTTYKGERVQVMYRASGAGVKFTPYTSPDLNFTENGTLIWIPSSMAPVTLQIVASSPSNLSTLLEPFFVLCGCALKDQCDNNVTEQVNGSSLYVSACICKNNYSGAYCDVPPDPCLQGCFTGVTCTTSTGCSLCPTGLTGDGVNCADADECSKVDSCALNANCINTVGSYSCTCKPGFAGNGTFCADIDECSKKPCHPSATCTNTAGSYMCACNAGFSGNGTYCADVDECLNNRCHQDATCTNTIGSYMCTCNAGFQGDGKSCCPSLCLPYYCRNGGTCTVSPSDCGQTCTCAPGYQGPTCDSASESFVPVAIRDLPKRTVHLGLESPSSFNSSDADAKVRDLVANLTMKITFNKNSNYSRKSPSSNNQMNLTSEFNYTGVLREIDFLNQQLVPELVGMEVRTRSVTPNIFLTYVVSGNFTNKDVLLTYFGCSGFTNSVYTLNPSTFMCESKCKGYCRNNAACNLTQEGPFCTCVPFSIYTTSGPTCDIIAMNLNAFFGILFGALAFLLLLVISIVLTVYCCRNRQTEVDDESFVQTDFYNRHYNKILLGFRKLQETGVPSASNAKDAPTLVNWKPHLENVDTSIKTKIARPQLLSESLSTDSGNSGK